MTENTSREEFAEWLKEKWEYIPKTDKSLLITIAGLPAAIAFAPLSAVAAGVIAGAADIIGLKYIHGKLKSLISERRAAKLKEVV